MIECLLAFETQTANKNNVQSAIYNLTPRRRDNFPLAVAGKRSLLRGGVGMFYLTGLYRTTPCPTNHDFSAPGFAGIETRMFYSVQRDEVYCKIRCPLERLEHEAVSVSAGLYGNPFNGAEFWRSSFNRGNP